MRFKKPLDALLKEAAQTGEGTLKRTLGAGNLIALGIGAIIGAGLFVRTAAAAADHAGPSVTLAFILAAFGCALAGLCYAEFASMIPIAGSAYTYSYATMGEMVAWIIGWDLVLEYAVGAATVSIAWSEYLNKLIQNVGISIPLSILPFTVPILGRWYTWHHQFTGIIYYSCIITGTYPRYAGISHIERHYCYC
jgi:APA family basic amino acid/polyamine antiporter